MDLLIVLSSQGFVMTNKFRCKTASQDTHKFCFFCVLSFTRFFPGGIFEANWGRGKGEMLVVFGAMSCIEMVSPKPQSTHTEIGSNHTGMSSYA